jgi:hypothetical protein
MRWMWFEVDIYLDSRKMDSRKTPQTDGAPALVTAWSQYDSPHATAGIARNTDLRR